MILTEHGSAVAAEMWDQVKDEFAGQTEGKDLVMIWLEQIIAIPELWSDEPGFLDAMRDRPA